MRCLIQVVVGWTFTLSLAPVAAFVSVGRPRRIFRPLQARLLRFWGRKILQLLGVSLVVSGEPWTTSQGGIVVFNHSSLLDIFIVLSLLPDNGVPVVKREVLWYPIVGWAVACMEIVAIPRGNSPRAHHLVARIAKRMCSERITVVIAPEGTRSPDGRLGEFKLGAFHLALVTHQPILPMVIIGAHRLLPKGRFCTPGGRTMVRVLAPFVGQDLRRENLREKALELRLLMENELVREEPGVPEPRKLTQ